MTGPVHQDWQMAAPRQLIYYNRTPFHLVIEMQDEVIIRIGFLMPDHPDCKKSSPAHPYTEQISLYLDGNITVLSLPHKLAVSAFAARVYDATKAIPAGETATYAQIAARIGNPRASRAVGAALASNPLPLIIPCHRVIGSNGKLTGFAGGLEMKRRLLALEQVR